DHVAQMQLGQLVVGQIEHGEAAGLELRGNLRRLVAIACLNAYEQLRFAWIADAIVEFGDAAAAEKRAEAAEAAAFLRNRHREQRLARLADFGAFRDETQTVEIEIRAARDCDKRLIAQSFALDILLQARDRERASRLEHTARVGEAVLDRRAQ